MDHRTLVVHSWRRAVVRLLVVHRLRVRLSLSLGVSLRLRLVMMWVPPAPAMLLLVRVLVLRLGLHSSRLHHMLLLEVALLLHRDGRACLRWRHTRLRRKSVARRKRPPVCRRRRVSSGGGSGSGSGSDGAEYLLVYDRKITVVDREGYVGDAWEVRGCNTYLGIGAPCAE